MFAAIRIRWGRIPSAALAALAFVLAGCGEQPGYPPDLEYPARSDRLVLRVPTAQPAGPNEAGKLDAELAALDSLGGLTRDPRALPQSTRDQVGGLLADLFGSPAAPEVKDAPGFGRDTLAEGSRLYRRHCLQCHGLTGDGRGPTGQWIDPHPRDFRRGAFKFTTTGDGGKPRTADLARTLREGVKGTGMPAFGLLPEADREKLVAYVKFLSLRGQTEFAALRDAFEDEEFDRGRVARFIGEWAKAETTPTIAARPAPDDGTKQSPDHLAAVKRGYELFTAKGTTDCLTCHDDFGRRTTWRYDVWGTVVRPADLTAGGFKGGDRPEQLFHRIKDGIQPSGMPAHPSLKDDQVWDLVWFVRAAPFPRELPDDVRMKVYP